MTPDRALLPLAGVFETRRGAAAGETVRAEGVVTHFAGFCRAARGDTGAAQACPELVEG
ncbi:MAG: hypothetical protein KDE53_30500 [Caldilineaceae bacterium]|nr:hypothetical protein [Caldilineaceae bacterium]